MICECVNVYYLLITFILFVFLDGFNTLTRHQHIICVYIRISIAIHCRRLLLQIFIKNTEPIWKLNNNILRSTAISI